MYSPNEQECLLEFEHPSTRCDRPLILEASRPAPKIADQLKSMVIQGENSLISRSHLVIYRVGSSDVSVAFWKYDLIPFGR